MNLLNFLLVSLIITVQSKPNIVVIMTDDMGWNDVSFHGSNAIPTPNIDALAYSGIILNRHYNLPTCTPSRTAFLTGRHPIRMGMQGLPLNVAEPRGVPLHETLLPEYLQQLGYVTRLLGKWHIGYYTDNHTPTRRGFDSFVGYYGGIVKYFDHTVTKNKHSGIDFHSDTKEKLESFNKDQYLTDLIADQAESIIQNHDKRKALYLHLAHVAAHASENDEPIEVRNLTEVNDKLSYIPNIQRRRYAGVVTALDQSVGRVVKALSKANMLNNTVIVFLSDNGAPTMISPYKNYGSNYPFRGLKSTLYEGGIRVPAFIFSPLIKNPSRVSNDYFHITDWFPTLLKLAGGNVETLQDIDGMDQWSALSEATKSERHSIFVNIDEVLEPESAIVGKYKLIRGVNGLHDYYAEDESGYSPKIYDVNQVFSSDSGNAIKSLTRDILPSEEKIFELREQATVRCQRKTNYPNCTDTCLFDITTDPCETTDISNNHPEMVQVVSEFLDSHRAILFGQTNTYIDPYGYPDNFNGFWMPWMDHEHTPPKDRNISIIWSTELFCEGYPVGDPRRCL